MELRSCLSSNIHSANESSAASTAFISFRNNDWRTNTSAEDKWWTSDRTHNYSFTENMNLTSFCDHRSTNASQESPSTHGLELSDFLNCNVSPWFYFCKIEELPFWIKILTIRHVLSLNCLDFLTLKLNVRLRNIQHFSYFTLFLNIWDTFKTIFAFMFHACFLQRYLTSENVTWIILRLRF